MDETWPQLTLVSSKLIEEITLVHANMHTHSNKQPGMHNPQHLCLIITMLSAGGKVWLSLTAGLKHESLLKRTGKTQRGAEREQ